MDAELRCKEKIGNVFEQYTCTLIIKGTLRYQCLRFGELIVLKM